MAEYSFSTEGQAAHVRLVAHQNTDILHRYMAKIVVHVDLWVADLPDHHPIHFRAELEIVLPPVVLA